MNRGQVALLAAAFVATMGVAGVYEWVDESGVTHYSEMPPPGLQAESLELGEPGNGSRADIDWKAEDEAFQKRRAERTREEAEAARLAMEAEPKVPNPPLASSAHLATKRVWIEYDFWQGILAGRLNLTVQAKRTLVRPVWIEAIYELPLTGSRNSALKDAPDPVLVITPSKEIIAVNPGREVTLSSPWAEHLHCRNYTVTIVVYDNASGKTQIGEHVQRVYSRVNGSRIRAASHLSRALAASGPCAP